MVYLVNRNICICFGFCSILLFRRVANQTPFKKIKEAIGQFQIIVLLTSPNKKTRIKGVFCISLDFEKYWGVHDVIPINDCAHFATVSIVVEKLLHLFKKYEIHATWATVGLLAQQNMEDLIGKGTKKPIPYQNATFSPFPLSHKEYTKDKKDILLGFSEIDAIINADNQEFASHTYSHFYCCEKGIDENDFDADCKKMLEIERVNNVQFTSIVFPRNQVNKKCLAICEKYNFSNYRGNQENRFWKNSSFEKESIFKKAGRVADAYFNISKTNGYTIQELKNNNGLVNIPANRFFRPYSGKLWMEKRKLKRIKNEMLRAAKNGEIYHLWWHPHNFSKHVETSIKQIEELILFSLELKEKYNFTSLNMGEISDRYAKK